MLNCWTISSDISGYHVDFHEEHGTIGAGQGRDMACVNLHGTAWQGNGMGTACYVWINLKTFKDTQAGLQQNSILPLSPTLYNLHISYAPQTLGT